MVLAMKTIVATLMGLAACMAAPAESAERRYSVTDFDRVQIEGPYQVSLATGLGSAVRAVGSQAAIDRVSIEVQGRTLRVRTNRSAWGGYPGDTPGTVVIEATTRALSAASVIGSGSLAIDKARGLKLDLAVSGSGRLGLAQADADNLVIALVGSGKISVGGKAKQLRASIQGSGDFDGRALSVDDAQIIADTAGEIAVGVRRTAKVNAIGPGGVEMIGHADCTLSGPAAAEVRCGD
jgi:hypothetical protein